MDDIFNEANAARYIGVSVDVLQRYRAGEGNGPMCHIDNQTGDVLYTKSDLDAWRQIYGGGAAVPDEEP